MGECGGFFTTFPVRDGVPVWSEAHITRIVSHAAEFGLRVDSNELASSLSAYFRGITGLHRGRIIVCSETGRYRFTDDTLHSLTTPVPCEIRRISDPLGHIKRYPFRNLGIPSGGELLLFDEKTGVLLEGNYTNVFVRRSDGLWMTPPADGTIIDGIGRRAFLRFLKLRGKNVGICHITESVVRQNDFFLTNALRGVMRGYLVKQGG